jgi:RecA/RadA recombinase
VLRSPSDAVRTSEAVAKLLRDLGSQLRRGDAPTVSHPRLTTGIPAIDRLLGGGIPGGRLSEIAGPLSSGRTSLALALLARATRAGGVTAVIDASDAFDPASAEAAGVDLARVLWVRAPRLREALRSAEHLLAARGFALVLLDLAVANLRIAPATGPRLARLAAGTGTPLVALSLERLLGTAAEVAVELTPARANFSGTPASLEDLEVEVALVRHRTDPARRTASVRLRSIQAA